MLTHERVEKTNRLFQVLSQLKDEESKLKIKNEIIVLNMPLVTTCVKEFKPYTEDQFQDGCIGLINAVNTFNPERNVAFSFWACFCIKRNLHITYKKYKNMLENNPQNLIQLDDVKPYANQDSIDSSLYEFFEDKHFTQQVEQFWAQDIVNDVLNQIIIPVINASAIKAKKSTSTKIDIDLWIELEILFLMGLIAGQVFDEKKTLTAMAKKLDISTTRARGRHVDIVNALYERLIKYMQIPFNELLLRTRGTKKIPNRLLCLDPGKSTGWALFVNGHLHQDGCVTDCYDEQTGQTHAKKLTDLIDELQPDFLLYENYKVYSHKLAQHSFSEVPVSKLIGAIEYFTEMQEIPTHKQMAVTAKGFVTDSKLKTWNFYQRAHNKHSRDAIRHGCYFLLFYKRGENII